MSVNKYKPHILVLPEDDANRQLAIGFNLFPDVNGSVIQVLPPAGGWIHVKYAFEHTHAAEMNRFEHRHMILLVDCDEQDNRIEDVRNVIPDNLKERVFVLGVWSEPEKLKVLLNLTYETIGIALATECRDQTRATWACELLRHNAEELARMTAILRPILFQ